ncbi:MAG: hypothetical protein ABFS56_23950 [Pseudomonadota bacterium]
MTTVTLNLSSDLYQRLHEESVSIGQSVEELIQDWLVKRRTISPLNEREQIREVLRAAGLLTELGPELQKRAEHSTATLEEVQAAFARAGGQPLSEMVIEMRGPKI